MLTQKIVSSQDVLDFNKTKQNNKLAEEHGTMIDHHRPKKVKLHSETFPVR